MKKVTLLVVMLAFFANISMAQNKERVNAFNYNKNAQAYITSAEQYTAQNRTDKAAKEMNNAKIMLQRAKTSIDLAAAHDETKNDAKTWHYYGIVYYKIAAYPEFNDIDTEALTKCADAFKKIGELDMDYYKNNYGDIFQHVNSITSNYFNQGAISYEAGDYIKAIESYRKAYETMAIIGQKDNEALLVAAQISVMAKEYNTAIELCNTLLNNSYESPQVYQYMAIAQGGLENNDAMVQYIQTGREKFPEDENLINEQINAFLKLKREAEIIDQIKEMANKNKENSVYCFILGTIYGNSESAIHSIDSAMVYYNRAIEINPNDENAYINIGSMFIDKSAALYNAANELGFDAESQKKYDIMVAEAKAFDEQALPFVEKAYELVPGDEAIKQALRTLYVRLKMMDKAKELESAE
ncbi:MAG: hypothetical protein IJZ87_03755 [Bacteroidales bacterium]|nr:hypothetical protein [Bacteroidales bacterium]